MLISYNCSTYYRSLSFIFKSYILLHEKCLDWNACLFIIWIEGDDNIPSGWLDPLQSSEPMAEDVPQPELHDTSLVTHHSELQDPQLVRVDNLRAQGDLLNAFDRRLHGNVSNISNSQCKYSFVFFITIVKFLNMRQNHEHRHRSILSAERNI